MSLVCRTIEGTQGFPVRLRVRGFSYVELMVAVAVVGIGICAAVAGIQVGLGSAHTAASIEFARHLAEEIRQFSEGLEFVDPQTGSPFGPEEGSLSSYDDVDDLDGLVQSPPIRGDGTVMTSLPDWCQKVSVRSLDPVTLALPADETAYTAIWQLSVTIERGGQVVGVYRWLVTDH